VALGQVFSENFGFPCQSAFDLLSTIIFTITRGWHNRPGVAAVPIVSQNKKKKKKKKNNMSNTRIEGSAKSKARNIHTLPSVIKKNASVC
jgi:hypothetical protein